jgi:hypothetical protein
MPSGRFLRLPVAERSVGLRKHVAHVSPGATSDARSTGRPSPLSVHELAVVARSIGEKDAPCQNQNGTFSDASWCVSDRHASARPDATASREAVYSLCQARCMAWYGWLVADSKTIAREAP